MRVLVTGGAGFIGSHVVDAYVAAGHEVSVLDNLSTGKLANLNPAATLYQADIRDPEGVARAFGAAQPEVVCHQAALADVRASMREPTLYAEVNIIGSINLLEAARRRGLPAGAVAAPVARGRAHRRAVLPRVRRDSARLCQRGPGRRTVHA